MEEKLSTTVLLEQLYQHSPQLLKQFAHNLDFREVSSREIKFTHERRTHSVTQESSLAYNIMMTLDWQVYKDIFSLSWCHDSRSESVLRSLLRTKRFDTVEHVMDKAMQELQDVLMHSAPDKEEKLKTLANCEEVMSSILTYPHYVSDWSDFKAPAIKRYYQLWFKAVDILSSQQYVALRIAPDEHIPQTIGEKINFLAHYARQYRIRVENSLLNFVAHKELLPFVKTLMNCPDVREELKECGESPLQWALDRDNLSTAQYLLKKKYATKEEIIFQIKRLSDQIVHSHYLVDNAISKMEIDSSMSKFMLCLQHLDEKTKKEIPAAHLTGYMLLWKKMDLSLQTLWSDLPQLLKDNLFNESYTTMQHMAVLCHIKHAVQKKHDLLNKPDELLEIALALYPELLTKPHQSTNAEVVAELMKQRQGSDVFKKTYTTLLQALPATQKVELKNTLLHTTLLELLLEEKASRPRPKI